MTTTNLEREKKIIDGVHAIHAELFTPIEVVNMFPEYNNNTIRSVLDRLVKQNLLEKVKIVTDKNKRPKTFYKKTSYF